MKRFLLPVLLILLADLPSDGKSFEQASLDAVQRFRYAPQFEDGKPVAVDGVKTRVGFRIRE